MPGSLFYKCKTPKPGILSNFSKNHRLRKNGIRFTLLTGV
ncbi:hypothetical protein T11_12391 [Trichinella zimbabwensis]|uniref:Uncharacterized protein n=1 Tax=Trichinella zimbabwensis TaxID=268475 RepID=A0A0V1G6H3_9BILA|nr:hypothetical protein T11_12391 [Trichinella zimbabwensis]